MTIALAYLFAVTLASLALGLASAFRRQTGSVREHHFTRVRKPIAAPKPSPLASALMHTERYGRVSVLPVEAEIAAMYGGDDIPMESLELPRLAPVGRVDDEIPW